MVGGGEKEKQVGRLTGGGPQGNEELKGGSGSSTKTQMGDHRIFQELLCLLLGQFIQLNIKMWSII